MKRNDKDLQFARKDSSDKYLLTMISRIFLSFLVNTFRFSQQVPMIVGWFVLIVISLSESIRYLHTLLLSQLITNMASLDLLFHSSNPVSKPISPDLSFDSIIDFILLSWLVISFLIYVIDLILIRTRGPRPQRSLNWQLDIALSGAFVCSAVFMLEPIVGESEFYIIGPPDLFYSETVGEVWLFFAFGLPAIAVGLSVYSYLVSSLCDALLDSHTEDKEVVVTMQTNSGQAAAVTEITHPQQDWIKGKKPKHKKDQNSLGTLTFVILMFGTFWYLATFPIMMLFVGILVIAIFIALLRTLMGGVGTIALEREINRDSSRLEYKKFWDRPRLLAGLFYIPIGIALQYTPEIWVGVATTLFGALLLASRRGFFLDKQTKSVSCWHILKLPMFMRNKPLAYFKEILITKGQDHFAPWYTLWLDTGLPVEHTSRPEPVSPLEHKERLDSNSVSQILAKSTKHNFICGAAGVSTGHARVWINQGLPTVAMVQKQAKELAEFLKLEKRESVEISEAEMADPVARKEA